jgi:two-component system sensor histidine kinase TctE
MNRARILSIGLILAMAGAAAAADDVTRFGPDDAQSELTIWSSTDLAELRPVIEDFLKTNPAVAIVHHDVQSADIYSRIREGRPAAPDLTISSATDLQVKLVNDGFALEHTLPGDIALQGWASWRSSAFGISVEPAVLVYHDSFRQFGTLPRSRRELARTINANRAALDGKIATYDIEQSGLGYLFASQDSLYSNTYTILMHSLGAAHARLYCCSGDMLDEIEKGTALIGYNVLGSYALARKRAGAPIEIVLPDDYALVLSRVALIPRGAKRPDLGGAFIDFLLSPQAQRHNTTLESYGLTAAVTTHPIPLNPTLLVFLDPIRKERFIRAWKVLLGSASD